MAISLTRLSGGITPANGSDPRTFPAIWNTSSTAIEAVAADLDTLEGTAFTGVVISGVADNDALVYNGTEWVNGVVRLLETDEKTADHTLVLADASKVVSMNKSSAGTVTVPANASVAFPIGTVINIYNQSADAVAVTGAAGVTVRNTGGLDQYAEVSLRKRAEDEWVLAGVVS
jgi:hypothetical protein